ncbi:MAG: outer membrane beta-barrel protein, partial [Campylobacterota bacterium]|nr:outer membrane beta-barrel protein [Campylobacterota bacterium]
SYGETILVESCDIHQWCKTENGYIKQFLVKETDEKNVYTSKKEEIFIYKTTSNIDEDILNEIRDGEVKYIIRDLETTNYDFNYIKLATIELAKKNIELKKAIKVEQVQKIETTKKVEVVEITEKAQEVEIIEQAEVLQQEIIEKPTQQLSNNFFLALGTHYTLFSFSQKEQDSSSRLLINDSDDDNGFGYVFSVGYKATDYLFFTLQYSRTLLDNAIVDNSLLAINYQLPNLFAKPYLGVSIGGSKLSWDDAVIDGIEESISTTSKKVAYGMQIGGEFELNDNFSFFGEYQMMMQEHKTALIAPNLDTEIIHGIQKNITLGIKYFF